MKHKLFFFITALYFSSAIIALADLPDTLWCKYTYPTQINCVKFTPDGQFLASGGTDGVVNIWNVATGKLIKSYSINNYSIDGIDFYGNMISFGGGFHTYIYDFNTDKLLGTVRGGGVAKFTNDGKYLITARGTDTTKDGFTIFSTLDFSEIKSINSSVWIETFDLSPDNQYLATGSVWASQVNPTPELDIYKFPSLEFVKTITKDSNLSIWQTIFAPNQYLGAACSENGDNIWDTSDWSLFRNFTGESYSCAFSPDNQYNIICSGGFHNWKINIFEIHSNENKYSYVLDWLTKKYLQLDYPDGANSISVSTDLKYIAIGGAAGIYLLNAKWNPTSVPENPVQITQPIIFPNPTSGTANIQFNLMQPSQININIFDVSSNLIAPIFNGKLNAGLQTYNWNTKGVASGTYFCRITAAGNTSTIKIIVNK